MFYSTVCFVADSHLMPLNRVVNSGSFLTDNVSGCNLAHRRYVTGLCMQFKIGSFPVHPQYRTLPWPYSPGHVTNGDLSVFATRCCRTQNRKTFLNMWSTVSLSTGLDDPEFDGVRWWNLTLPCGHHKYGGLYGMHGPPRQLYFDYT